MKKGILKSIVSITLVTALLLSNASSMSAKKKVVKLNKKKVTLTVGKKVTLKLKNAKNVKWKSLNKKIATVTKKGVVKAKKKGSTKIIATYKKKKYTCKVTVKAKKTTTSPTPEVTASIETPVASPVVTASPEASSTAPTGSAIPQESAPAPVESEAAAPSSSPIVVPDNLNPMTQIVWEEGMKSGTLEDYKKYFRQGMTKYESTPANVGTIESFTYHSDVVGADRDAYVFLPPNYDPNETYPVMYAIHGIGATRDQWVNMGICNMLSVLINRKEVVPFICIIPSVIPKEGVNPIAISQENAVAYTMFQDEFTKDLEPYVLKNFNVSNKPEDTAVCGLSMGGMESLRLGFKIKNHFNYIGAFSPAWSLTSSDLVLDEEWTFAPRVILICSGDADTTVNDTPENYHKALVDNKIEHMWYVHPEGGHNDPVWKQGIVNFVKYCFK